MVKFECKECLLKDNPCIILTDEGAITPHRCPWTTGEVPAVWTKEETGEETNEG